MGPIKVMISNCHSHGYVLDYRQYRNDETVLTLTTVIHLWSIPTVSVLWRLAIIMFKQGKILLRKRFHPSLSSYFKKNVSGVCVLILLLYTPCFVTVLISIYIITCIMFYHTFTHIAYLCLIPMADMVFFLGFSFQPVLHSWCNKGRGMYYHVCGMVNIKDVLLLIEKSSPCSGGSGVFLSLYEWLLTLCPTPYITVIKCFECAVK